MNNNPWRVIAHYRGRCSGRPSETIHVVASYEEAQRSKNHHAVYMAGYATITTERGTNLDKTSKFTVDDLLRP